MFQAKTKINLIYIKNIAKKFGRLTTDLLANKVRVKFCVDIVQIELMKDRHMSDEKVLNGYES